MKKTLLFILQLEIGLGIIAYFFVNMYASGKIVEFAHAFATVGQNLPLLIGGMSLFLICLLLCIKRWQILLRAQEINTSYWQTLVLYFVGHFFNSLLPGATSGDLMKAVYVAREHPEKKAEAVTTVVVDRLIGLIALVSLSVVMMAIRLPFFLAYKETKIALIVNLAILIGMISILVLVFAQNLFEKWPFFRKMEEKSAIGPLIRKIYTAFHTCIKSPGILAQTYILSVVNHIVLIIGVFMIGLSLGIPLNFGVYLTVFPIINAIAAIPITPGGIGTRDVATVFLFGVLGVAQPVAISLSLLAYLTPVAWSLVGGVFYIGYLMKLGKS